MDAIVNSFGLDWKLFLAEAVNFLIVLGILYYFVSKKIFPVMEKRVTKIQEGVENADKAEEVLADSETKAKDIIKNSQSQADENIKKSVDDAKDKKDQILAEASDKSKEIILDAESKGQVEKDKIIASSKEEMAKMIVLGAEKVLSSK